MYKVIVVEDEELVRKGIVLATDWASLNCVVVGEAANGLEGCELVRRHSPHLVITDVKMPVMSGVEMVEALRKEGCKADFIFLTAYSDFAYAQKALKMGVADYLLKPFVDGELEQAVEKVKHRIAAENEGLLNDDGIVLRFNVPKGAKSRYVELALEYISENYPSPDISVKEVAEHLSISEGYLSRVFKKETSYTFNNYLTHYRIHAAMEELRDRRVKVYEVAEKVGYQDTTYFSTLFKKLTGITPSEFQDRC